MKAIMKESGYSNGIYLHHVKEKRNEKLCQ